MVRGFNFKFILNPYLRLSRPWYFMACVCICISLKHRQVNKLPPMALTHSLGAVQPQTEPEPRPLNADDDGATRMLKAMTRTTDYGLRTTDYWLWTTDCGWWTPPNCCCFSLWLLALRPECSLKVHCNCKRVGFKAPTDCTRNVTRPRALQ